MEVYDLRCLVRIQRMDFREHGGQLTDLQGQQRQRNQRLDILRWL